MTFQPGYNPFQTQDIFVSKAYHEEIKEMSLKGSGDGEHEGMSGQPFKRMVDAWLLAVALGSTLGHTPPEIDTKGMVKVITGSVFQKDLEVISFLMSIAVAETKDPYVVEDPRRMMRVAAGFAELGFPIVIELSRSGQLGSTENLVRGLVKSLSTI